MRTSALFLASCLLVLCAGVVVGRLSIRMDVPASPTVVVPASGPSSRPSWIADQLGLSPQQRQQMDAIWAETRQKIGKAYETRHNADKDRDKAIQDLLSDAQKTQYAQITDEWRARRLEISKERDRLIHEAEERSKALLNEQQLIRWTAIHASEHGGDHPEHGRGGHGEHNTTTNSTTMPAQAGTVW